MASQEAGAVVAHAVTDQVRHSGADHGSLEAVV